MRRNDLWVAVLFFNMAAGYGDDVPAFDEQPAVSPKAVTPAKPVASKTDIEQWIVDLNAPEFATREEATRQLIDAGLVAVAPLIEASKSSNLETSVRITAILRTWFTSGREELVETAETALEQLTESKNRSMSHRAVAVLNQYALTIRQDRALAQIKKLGGTIKAVERMAQQPFGQNDTDGFFVILGRGWQGADEGLKHVRRLPSLTTLYLIHHPKTHKILTPNVSADAVAELQKAMPQLAIVYRGPAYLGISGDARFGGNGCVVRIVQPDAPAAKAEVKSGDVIAKFDGKPVADFEGLIDLIAEKNPGDVAKLEILRGDDEDMRMYERLRALKEPNPAKELLEEIRKRLTKEVDVTLGEWK